MYEAMQRVVDYGREMRSALGKNEFFFKMQPIIKLRNSEVLGFEMLARWEHPVRGVMNPIEFINIAEETGLIIDIGRHVLNTACRLGGNWLERGAGGPSPLICVNISGRELYDAGFPALLREVLDSCGLKPHMLCLDLSEFAVGKDEPRAFRRLEDVKSLGVKLALDDFGIGASSINSLKKFPFDLLKIDNSLIGKIDTGPAHLDSVKAIVELAHSLDMKVVAEGVSRKKQAEILREIGCDYGQGFHFARPMSADHAGDVYERGLQRAS
jgi:EAL domain-containing protein (putative c-di-GMP-specific phosphodiesterase class I)